MKHGKVLAADDLAIKLELSLHDRADVYINSGVDADVYIAGLVDEIHANRCTPFWLTADISTPGFPDRVLNGVIEGWCVAHSKGYWLVYEPDEDRFYAFWGSEPGKLGAPGIFGSALYCWSA